MSFVLASSAALQMYWNAFWLSTRKKTISMLNNSGRHDGPLFRTAETCLQSSRILTATLEVPPDSQHSRESKISDSFLSPHHANSHERLFQGRTVLFQQSSTSQPQVHFHAPPTSFHYYCGYICINPSPSLLTYKRTQDAWGLVPCACKYRWLN